MSDSPYDVVVIGSGPGGYVCAIRCAQLGLKTACVERWPTYGGTCLNVGCIPSKALLESSELLHRAKTEFKRHGIQVDPTFDLGKMMKRKAKIVTSLTRGVGSLFEKNGIDGIQGLGSIEGPGRVKVTAEDGSTRILETTSIVIATGSEVSSIPGVELDGELVQVGRRLFGLPPKTAVEVMDGRRFLELSQTRYDLIMLDAYRDIYVPFHLTTREFFHQVRRRLAPGGAVAINLLAWRDEQSLVNAVAGTLGSAFDHVVVLRRPPMLNVMLYAYNGRRATGRYTQRNKPWCNGSVRSCGHGRSISRARWCSLTTAPP